MGRFRSFLLIGRGSSPFPPLGSVAEYLTRHAVMHDDGTASGAANDPTIAAIKRCRALAVGGVAANDVPIVGVDCALSPRRGHGQRN